MLKAGWQRGGSWLVVAWKRRSRRVGEISDACELRLIVYRIQTFHTNSRKGQGNTQDVKRLLAIPRGD